MTLNGTTTEGASENGAAPPPVMTALFLETSAQFHRLTGPEDIRKIINEMIDGAGKVGTSWYVEREFKYVYGRFFDTVISEIKRLSHPTRPREFGDMWMSVDYQLPVRFAGGPKFFWSLFMILSRTLRQKLAAEFGGESVTPQKILNKVAGLKETLLKGFVRREDFFNKSYCGVWDQSCSSRCDPEPDADCRLKEIGVDMRDDFLAAAGTVSRSDCSESTWLKANLHRLEDTHGKALLDLMGRHRDYVSDIVIFWEVPEGWTILTRDRAFAFMQKAHRDVANVVKVYNLRLPREASGAKCLIQPQAAPETEGVLVNYTAKGARVRADPVFVKRLRKRERVIISSEEFADGKASEFRSRNGRVVYRDEKDASIFAVRFPSE